MSFYTLSLMGIAPFGSLLAGAVATRIGAAHTVAVGGLFCLAGALVFKSQLAGLGGSEVGEERSEVREQKSEIRDQKSEVRGQTSEVRGQSSEVRPQRTRPLISDF